MFSLSALSPYYAYPVKFVLLNAEGEQDTHQFKAHFFRYTLDEIRAQADAQENMSIADVVKKVMAGWEDVTDEVNAPLPFTPENLDRLLQISGVGIAIVEAFWKSCRPQSADEILQKN